MALARAELATVDAGLAKVVVASITHAAVEVDVVHCVVTFVAVHRPSGRTGNVLGAKSELMLATVRGELGKEV